MICALIEEIVLKILDVKNHERINQEPDQIKKILESNPISEQGFLIKNLELRWYKEKFDKKNGQYSHITALVETDRGSVETTFEEGFLGDSPLDRAAEFLASQLGISGVILRSLITLKNELEKQNT